MNINETIKFLSKKKFIFRCWLQYTRCPRKISVYRIKGSLLKQTIDISGTPRRLFYFVSPNFNNAVMAGNYFFKD